MTVVEQFAHAIPVWGEDLENKEFTISAQTVPDVYCKICHDVTDPGKREYFRMIQNTFFDHLIRVHPDDIDTAAQCSLCNKKFNTLNTIKKHISKQHKEIQYKQIMKHHQLAEKNFDEEKMIKFPIHVKQVKPPFVMLREGETEAPLLEGNENCFGCIRRSKKSIVTRAHEEEPRQHCEGPTDVTTQTCIANCPYTRTSDGPEKIIISKVYEPVYHKKNGETPKREQGKYI